RHGSTHRADRAFDVLLSSVPEVAHGSASDRRRAARSHGGSERARRGSPGRASRRRQDHTGAVGARARAVDQKSQNPGVGTTPPGGARRGRPHGGNGWGSGG